MDKKEIKEYNDSIRRMLEHEDGVRSQRTNWFLVIQGLLINAILMVLKIEDLHGITAELDCELPESQTVGDFLKSLFVRDESIVVKFKM